MQNLIEFPGLGLSLNINRVAFSIGNLHVYWYGILIAIGFLCAMWYACKACKYTGVKADHIVDMVLFGVPAGIIGARALYVIFNYNKLYYYDFWGMFRIWDGGSAIFGGLVLAIIVIFIYCKVRRIRFGNMLDVAGPALLIAQCIGRWGNFTNQEVYGTACSHFLRMGLYVSGEYVEVHPLFLYESVWTLLGFLILRGYMKRRKYNGEIFMLAMFWYGLGRSFIEPLRENTLYFGNSNLKVNLVFAVLSCLLGLGLLIYTYLFKERDPESLTHPYLPKKAKKKNGEEEEEAAAAQETAEDTGDANVIGGISFESLQDEPAAGEPAEEPVAEEEGAEEAEVSEEPVTSEEAPAEEKEEQE